MGWVTSSSVSTSSEETNASIMNGASDLALHLGWYLTPSYQCKRLNMVGSNMVEVNGMNTVDEHFHPMNHWLEVEGMDTVEEHFHPLNHRAEVEGMDTVEEHFHPLNNRP
jgi:hypothetical protein